MTLSNMRKNGLILALFAVIATALVVGTEKLTASQIERQAQQQLLSTLNQIIPPARHDNDLYQSCRLLTLPQAQQPSTLYRAWLAQKPQAVAMQVTAPNGYSGAIRLLVAVDNSGYVMGVRVLEHKETPGLGDKIETRKSDWINEFNGKTVKGADDDRWAVKRDGGMFDQFTGATITPRAVVGAVERAVEFIKANPEKVYSDNLPHCQEQHHE
ncbi:electron transport complex subunit RsxG [Idiomarina tyrosinivorans]|uniref:Ion-translocating oxidoreductase complex subunit G n=1 Tax=Idiomarina tyrosinivorans TaxID=1445662 RepID=A0A432ZLG2_9GAMM|nr:electron transport complex subunit RsxG [Idiomarina tyrosinivorans]RUO78816.1 electron transport complex subunit RsxG [Idiomarina tyrosinivorans]